MYIIVCRPWFQNIGYIQMIKHFIIQNSLYIQYFCMLANLYVHTTKSNYLDCAIDFNLLNNYHRRSRIKYFEK